MWAPITGPISETNTGSEPNTCRHSSTRRRAVSGSWMCWTTQASAPALLALVGELDHALERAPARAHALDRRDLLLEREDRLDLQRRAEQRLRGADPPAPAQVLERVDREPHLQRLARRARPAPSPRPRSRPRAAARAAISTISALAAAGRAAVPDADPLAARRRSRSAAGAPGGADSQVPEMPGEMWIETISRRRASSGS